MYGGTRARPGYGRAIMQVFRLLAARRFRRRAVSTITATTAPATPCSGGYWGGEDEDEGPFFDLDLSSCSAPASSAESSSESEESCAGEVDFVISLQRSCSSSPSCERLFIGGGGGGGWLKAPPMKFCASEPNDAAARFRAGRRGKLRRLSFASAKAAFYGGGRASFSRSSNSARSARLSDDATHGHGSPDQDESKRAAPSADVIRRYLSKISRRLRSVTPSAAAASELPLRKSRSASAAQTAAVRSPPQPLRDDDTLFEKQDGIASAIAHCKESLHRASVSSEHNDSSLLRSRSDPGT